MSTIAITGVAGFIGSHLAERLINEGHHVVGFDNFDSFYSTQVKRENLSNILSNKNFQFFEIDINTENFGLALSNLEVETMVHLAARAGVRPSILFPQSYVKQDIEATVHLLETCKKLKINNIIFGSSSSIYGNSTNIPYKESETQLKPISPYAAAKLSCEMFNHVYHSQFGMNITNLRFFTVYGPRQRPEMAIHKFIKRLIKHEEITIYGDGSTSRDYTYIEDIIDGIVSSINHFSGYKTYNLGNSHAIKLIDLINLISSELQVEPNIKFISMQPGDVEHTLADITLAMKDLNYNPKTLIQEGISKSVKWFKDNRT